MLTCEFFRKNQSKDCKGGLQKSFLLLNLLNAKIYIFENSFNSPMTIISRQIGGRRNGSIKYSFFFLKTVNI